MTHPCVPTGGLQILLLTSCLLGTQLNLAEHGVEHALPQSPRH